MRQGPVVFEDFFAGFRLSCVAEKRETREQEKQPSLVRRPHSGQEASSTHAGKQEIIDAWGGRPLVEK
jgi:hypothetical protein